MLYSIKKFWLVLMLLVAGAPSVFGFSIIGPYETWQVKAIGYAEVGDDGGPKDLGDGFRWNTRTLYYACDASYSAFFGSNGLAAIDSAFLVFNNLSNLSSYTPGLTEWPQDTTRINFTAQTLNLIDVKSMTMARIVNMLGLGQPDRYVWDIHDRFIPAGFPPCPLGENYVVVQRNFDPVTYEYSSFVNGALYDYTIIEICTGTDPLAIALPVQVDPNATIHTAVADDLDAIYNSSQFFPGVFFTGLTRDDVGGLRYLMATNRMNVETVASNVFQLSTNPIPTNIVTSNLMQFYAQALTNPPAALQAIYPDLIITSTNVSFTNVVTTNVTAVITNPPPPFVPGSFITVLVTNFTTNVQPVFFYQFANLVIYTNFSNSPITTVTTTVGQKPFTLPGTLQTNITSNTVIVTNLTNGAFFIVPASLCGGFANITPQLTNIIATTNFIPVVVAPGVTNTNGIGAGTVIEATVTFFTNYILVANPVNCATNSASLREGVDKINFVRVDFDSILGTNWGPVTNIFQLTAVSNGTPVVQTLRRVVTQPDILIRAEDFIANNSSTVNFVLTSQPGSLNFNATVESSDGFGPGTIEPPVQFIYGKGGGPIFWNQGLLLNQDMATAIVQGGTFVLWGTFDGSTNDPIVYPSGTSLAGLESLVFFQISTAQLPAYSRSTNSATNQYNATLQALGGTQPYVWSLAPNSPALPPGLTMSTGGLISGVTSASAGTVFDFVVQVMDAGSRTNQAALSITINP